MNDIYFDPPILIINNKYFSYKDFKNDPIEIFDEINASNCNACLEKSSCYLK